MKNSCGRPRKDVNYSEFLTRLLRAQWHHRQETALEYRIRLAKLPERRSLETFPFDRQPGVSLKQIRGFAALEFIVETENLTFIGPRLGENGISLRSCAEGFGEWLPLPVHRAPRIYSRRYMLLSPTVLRAMSSPPSRVPFVPGRVADQLVYFSRTIKLSADANNRLAGFCIDARPCSPVPCHEIWMSAAFSSQGYKITH
jgi:hypothetical protein